MWGFLFDKLMNMYYHIIMDDKEIEIEKIEVDEIEWYKTNKFFDNLIDKIPYGWRIYYRYYDVKRWFISTYQKIRYGVSDQECWSLDCTITRFILPRLKHFKKINVHSHPADLTPEKWEEILDEMIWTFEYLDNDDKFNQFPQSCMNHAFGNDRTKSVQEQIDWEKYLDKYKELDKRKDEGLMLFAKYYQHLWD
jgi:hypothetical protein